MEGLIFDLDCKINEVFNMTVYSDLHDDARECAHNTLKAHLDRRAALPNSMFFGIGDVSNFIMPGPDKRSTPSTSVDALAAADEYIDEQVERQYEMYKTYPWIAMGLGNHCTSVTNKHYTNPIKRLVRRLNEYDDRKLQPCRYAGYSGFARFRLRLSERAGAHGTFNMIYHHGAWGGAVIKGRGGAQRWADRHAAGQLWNVMVYGHNHACQCDMIPNLGMTSRGVIYHQNQYIVNTGTFLLGQRQGGNPAYSEIRGYPPVSLAAPLIKFRVARDGKVLVSVEIGDC